MLFFGIVETGIQAADFPAPWEPIPVLKKGKQPNPCQSFFPNLKACRRRSHNTPSSRQYSLAAS